MTKKFSTSAKVTVRFSDTDAMGHCNNSRIISFMEEGRVAYFAKLYPNLTGAEQFQMFPFILADIQCSFKSPAFCGEDLTVHLGTTRFGNKSFDMEYVITEEKTKRIVATGQSVLVMYDYNTKTTYSIPQDLKDRIRKIDKI